jgi:hypothetical protein
MNIRNIITTKSAFALTIIAANLMIFSTADAEARGGGRNFPGNVRDHRVSSPPPLASAHTTVRPARVVSGCGSGRYCATTNANGGVVVTTRGNRGRFPRR